MVFVTLSACFQEKSQLFDGACTMTDFVFNGFSQLGKALIIAVGNEDGVVTKALLPVFLGSNVACDDAFELMLNGLLEMVLVDL